LVKVLISKRTSVDPPRGISFRRSTTQLVTSRPSIQQSVMSISRRWNRSQVASSATHLVVDVSFSSVTRTLRNGFQHSIELGTTAIGQSSP